MEKNTKAILVVSFGTSFEETRKKTIDQIENDIQNQYPEYKVFRAWTSGMICRKILKRDGIKIMSVEEALQQILSEGFRQLIVQPTHVINGIENDSMVETVMKYKEQFSEIQIGTPLLTSQEDNVRMVEAVAETFHPQQDEALILMGHGTEHFANAIYAAMDYQFKDMGYENIFMGTVEAYPSFEMVLKKVKKLQPKRVTLAPFMIVAGDHATNDLSGDDEDSWKSQFSAAGFEVSCVLKGLGEYPQVREMFLTHVAEAQRIK